MKIRSILDIKSIRKWKESGSDIWWYFLDVELGADNGGGSLDSELELFPLEGHPAELAKNIHNDDDQVEEKHDGKDEKMDIGGSFFV